MSDYTTMHQYEPLRVPQGWSAEEKRLVAQLTEIFDDLYRRFNRLRFEDLGKSLRGRIEDTEGNVSEVKQTAESLEALLNGTRFTLTAEGVTIRNAAGNVVFAQDAATGNLTISGHLTATGGTIGGFTIGETSLYNGTTIELSSQGRVTLGDLTIQDDPTWGPTLQVPGGIRISAGNVAMLTLGEGQLYTPFAVYADGGLYIDPNDVTNKPCNAYIDPTTGRLYRTTSTGTGGGAALSAEASVSATSLMLGGSVVITTKASGGSGSYTYTVSVSRNNGSYTTLGSGATRTYTPSSTGTYRFRVVVKDSAGSSVTVYTPYCTVEAAPEAFSFSAWANRTNAQVGDTVTFGWSASGGETPYTYGYALHGPNGYAVTNTASTTSTSLSWTLNQAGTWTLVVAAEDATGERIEKRVSVTVSAAVTYGMTTGTKVNMRSGPGTGYSVVLQIAESGTIVEITGAKTGGWWPVRYNMRNGYISADYIQVL